MDVIVNIRFQVISACPRSSSKPFMDDIEMTIIAKRTLAQIAAEVPYLVFGQNSEALTRGIAFLGDTRPGVMLIDGGPGVGKTLLMHRLVSLYWHQGRAARMLPMYDLIHEDDFDSLTKAAMIGQLQLLVLDSSGYIAHGLESDSTAQARCVGLFQAILRNGGKLILDHADWGCGPVGVWLTDIERLATDDYDRAQIRETVTLAELKSDEAVAFVHHCLERYVIPPDVRQWALEEAMKWAEREGHAGNPRVLLGGLANARAYYRIHGRTDGLADVGL